MYRLCANNKKKKSMIIRPFSKKSNVIYIYTDRDLSMRL